MKKFLYIVLILGIYSCADEPAEQVNPVGDENVQTLSDEIQGTYTGVVPCEDCEGIEIELILTSGRYNMSVVYQGKSDQIQIEDGTFLKEADHLQLYRAENKGLDKYLIKPGQLILLDSLGNEYTGSAKDRYILYLDEEAEIDFELDQDEE